MHMYVRPHTLSLPHPRPPRLVSHMRVRTHTLTATSPSAPPTVPPTASPTLPPSYRCSHALPHIHAHLCGPAHSLTPQSIPSLRTPTPSGPDLLPPSPCPLPRQIRANVRAFTIFRTPSLPPLTWPSCPISSCMHAITIRTHPHPCAHVPPDPHAPSPWCRTHARVACLFVLFSCNTFFCIFLCIYNA